MFHIKKKLILLSYPEQIKYGTHILRLAEFKSLVSRQQAVFDFFYALIQIFKIKQRGESVKKLQKNGDRVLIILTFFFIFTGRK